MIVHASTWRRWDKDWARAVATAATATRPRAIAPLADPLSLELVPDATAIAAAWAAREAPAAANGMQQGTAEVWSVGLPAVGGVAVLGGR